MKNKDDLILEQLYQEGILDRIGGQFKGVKAGSGQLLQNLGRKIYQKAGGEAMPPSSQTAGQSYAKAQQKSLLDSFTKKTGKEIEDFKKENIEIKHKGGHKDYLESFFLDSFYNQKEDNIKTCLLYTSPSPRDRQKSRMPSSA